MTKKLNIRSQKHKMARIFRKHPSFHITYLQGRSQDALLQFPDFWCTLHFNKYLSIDHLCHQYYISYNGSSKSPPSHPLTFSFYVGHEWIILKLSPPSMIHEHYFSSLFTHNLLPVLFPFVTRTNLIRYGLFDINLCGAIVDCNSIRKSCVQ